MTASVPRLVGVGVAGWSAGTDLFLDVARRVADDPSVRAELWWTGRRSSGAARWLDLDAELCGVRDDLRWTSGTAPVLDGAAPSVCVVPARDAAERDRTVAQVSGRGPLVCFALPDAADPTGVEVVDYPDTVEMAERVCSLLRGTVAP